MPKQLDKLVDELAEGKPLEVVESGRGGILSIRKRSADWADSGAQEGDIMASSKAYLDFILEQLSELDDVEHRAMMGEYIIYYRGKVIGGFYDVSCKFNSPKASPVH